MPIEQFAVRHHSKMFRPLHRELYVPQPGRLEIIVCIFDSLRIHGLRQPLESLGSQFGQQAGDISEVVSRRTMRDPRRALSSPPSSSP
jgi:hypothetical protein